MGYKLVCRFYRELSVGVLQPNKLFWSRGGGKVYEEYGLGRFGVKQILNDVGFPSKRFLVNELRDQKRGLFYITMLGQRLETINPWDPWVMPNTYISSISDKITGTSNNDVFYSLNSFPNR